MIYIYLYRAERLNVLYERNWTMLVHEQLRRFEGSIVAATKGGLIETMGDHFPRWTFSEALLYSVTVITTIGKRELFFVDIFFFANFSFIFLLCGARNIHERTRMRRR